MKQQLSSLVLFEKLNGRSSKQAKQLYYTISLSSCRIYKITIVVRIIITHDKLSKKKLNKCTKLPQIVRKRIFLKMFFQSTNS